MTPDRIPDQAQRARPRAEGSLHLPSVWDGPIPAFGPKPPSPENNLQRPDALDSELRSILRDDDRDIDYALLPRPEPDEPELREHNLDRPPAIAEPEGMPKPQTPESVPPALADIVPSTFEPGRDARAIVAAEQGGAVQLAPVPVLIAPDLVAFFQAAGPDYEARINAALKSYVRAVSLRSDQER